MSDHRARYKNTGLDAKELRRRREEDSVQLRKQKRDDVLSKRRTVAPVNAPDDPTVKNEDESPETRDHMTITQEVISALTQNENLQLLIDNAKKVRKILSQEPLPPFDDVIQSGLMPRFIQLLEHPDTTVQFEVAWILTNISSGATEQTRAVVSHGAIPQLIKLLSNPDKKVSEQSVWALGNIIGDGAELRDLVISHGFMPPFLALIRPDIDISFLRNATWVLVNLCRNKDPPPSLELIQQLMPGIIYLIQSTDISILVDITWAVSYITELGPEYVQLTIDSGLVTKMTPLLDTSEIKIQTATIRALGSIATGNEEQTQAVIDAGALPYLRKLLKERRDRSIKDALWFVSNITAGSTRQLQAVIDNDIIPSVIFHMENGDFSQQKEAAWAIYNLSLSGSPRQVKILVTENAIPSLCNLLSLKDSSLIRNVLETLSCILTSCYESNPEICDIIEECGGLDKIEQLQQESNNDIYNFAFTIIEQYFSEQ